MSQREGLISQVIDHDILRRIYVPFVDPTEARPPERPSSAAAAAPASDKRRKPTWRRPFVGAPGLAKTRCPQRFRTVNYKPRSATFLPAPTIARIRLGGLSRLAAPLIHGPRPPVPDCPRQSTDRPGTPLDGGGKTPDRRRTRVPRGRRRSGDTAAGRRVPRRGLKRAARQTGQLPRALLTPTDPSLAKPPTETAQQPGRLESLPNSESRHADPVCFSGWFGLTLARYRAVAFRRSCDPQ
jgi:hypothetical protein